MIDATFLPVSSKTSRVKYMYDSTLECVNARSDYWNASNKYLFSNNPSDTH